jgi:hypothetical protein
MGAFDDTLSVFEDPLAGTIAIRADRVWFFAHFLFRG